MKTAKNPGLGARRGSIDAALAVSTASSEASPPEEKPVAISIRFPKPIHDELRRIAYEQRVSIHSLILAGVQHVIEERG
jgi:hypothetical protein